MSSDRSERTVYRITAADLDAVAGHELTDEQLDTFERAIGFSSVPEAVETILDSIVIVPGEDDDRLYNRIAEHDAGEHTTSWTGCPVCEAWTDLPQQRKRLGLD